MFVFSPDVFDLSLSDCCLQESEDTTENGINPELAKVSYTGGSAFSHSLITQLLLPTFNNMIFKCLCTSSILVSVFLKVS